MDNVFFEPWIGENYYNGGNFNKRILVIGNSHYCKYRSSCSSCGVDGYCFEDSGCYNLTNDVIDLYINRSHWQKWMITYQKFERALCGYTTDSEDSKDIWNSIAFYNYLQTAVDNWKDEGNDDDYFSSEDAFWEVLEELRPDCIIFWGNRVWNMAPAFNNDDEDSYELDDGTEIPVLFINHPSWVRFHWEEINTKINDFLNDI